MPDAARAEAPTPTRYLLRETIVSVVINALFSAAFVSLVFGGRARIWAWGTGGLALDFLPQTFMVALMGSFVPGLIAHKRVRSGVMVRMVPLWPLPAALWLRSLLLAIVATVLLAGFAIGVLALVAPAPLTFASVLQLKVAFGMLVALCVTPVAIRAALADGWRGA